MHKLERRYFKAINFDLNTSLLNKHHPSKDYHKAYCDLKKFFTHHWFYHKQGSGYVSIMKINSQDIYLLIDALCDECNWIVSCVKEFDVTNLGTQYELVDDIKVKRNNDIFAID